jgi:glycosyltransferase involved in cell wall biosynthesis
LQNLADELGITSAVHWLGWQRDLSIFYHAIDLLLFNAEWDAFPTTPLEAMSHGLPVVASLIHGGLKEVIDSPEHGFLIAEHDLNRLTAATIELCNDPAKRAAAGQRARARIASICDADACVSHLERLLTG